MKILRVFDILLYLVAAVFWILHIAVGLGVYRAYAIIFMGAASILLLILSLVQICRGKDQKK